jgi:LacI family transcriptional regulator
MIRLADIAREAGLATMTVSRALRGSKGVAAATRARVEALARGLGYLPDATARSLRTRSTRLAAVVVPRLDDPATAELVAALEPGAQALGLDTLVAQTLGVPELEERLLRRLLGRRVTVLFWMPAARLESAPRYAVSLPIGDTRLVVLGPAPHPPQAACVETDDLRATYEATTHLLELGHRRIALLAGPNGSRGCQRRQEGFRQALRHQRLALEESLVFVAGPSLAEGAASAARILQERPGVTAIVAVSDLSAMGAATFLLEQGIQIPRDVSLVTIGGSWPTAAFRVPLTAAVFAPAELACRAMEAVTSGGAGGRVPRQVVAARLTIRASTGAPPSEPRL